MEQRVSAPPLIQECESCLVRNISICRSMSACELRALAECGLLKSYAPGEEILDEADVAEHVFNITSGTVMMSRLLSDARRQILGFFIQGDFLGLTAGSDYAFTVEAITQVQVCRFPLKPFRRLLLETPSLEQEMLARASDELTNSWRHVTLLGRKTALERVSTFLLDMAGRQARLGGSPDLAFLPMTRAQIADYLGLTLETVSRTFSILRRRALIEVLPHATVRLLHREAMKALAEVA